MTEKTFAELYCEQNGLKPEQYEAVVLSRSLYLHARVLAPLVRALWSDHFAADIDFVRNVARLRRFREFAFESEEFAHHPANRGFWRLTVNLRVSSRALRRLVRATLHPELGPQPETETHTAMPFGSKTAGKNKPSPKHSSEASA